ncbi:MAG: VanZ family protein [Candidatus Acidiferrales bacterium]
MSIGTNPESSSASNRSLGLRHLLPIFLWIALVALLSSNLVHVNDPLLFLAKIARRFLPDFAEPALLNRLNLALWKLGHVAAYFVLSLLLWRLWRRGEEAFWRWSWALRTLAVGLIFAGLNELFQLFAPPRTARATDIALDAAGILLALALLRRQARRASVPAATDQEAS